MLEETADAPTATTAVAEAPVAPVNPDPAAEHPVLVEADLLVEDVSIDGMCGVY